MPRTLKVAVAGLGPVGQAVARLVLQTPGLKLAAAADPAARYAGVDVGSVLGLPRKLGVKVDGDPERWLRKVRADVAFVCTSSLLKEVRPQVASLVGHRMHVLTSCEELAHPASGQLSAFREIDRLARARKVGVLATGVNPGFAMDALALTLTGPCAKVRRVAVTRVVDAGGKLTIQRRVGAGLNLGQFRRALTEGTIRHVGLPQSAQMIAAALGWKLDRLDETVEPAIAPRDLDTEYLRIPAGAVAGLKQCLRAYRGDELAISLDLQVYVGAESPRDHVLVDGDPPIDATIAGGLSSEASTAALLVNSLARVLASPPGLLTVKDLPLVHALNPQDLAAAPRRKR
ncbi:MAG: dihydrodipicolinate reductase [Betaproteobacteria bacterium]